MKIILLNLKNALPDIGNAFISDPSVWWLLAPVAVLWILTEIYAGEYKQEAFSFSGLLLGSTSLLWMTVVSARIFFLLGRNPLMDAEFFALMVMVAYAVFLIYVSFTRVLSHGVAKWIGRSSFLYFLSALAVLWGQGVLPFDIYTVLDLVIIYLVIDVIFAFIKINFLGLRGDVERVREAGEKK